ncbi:unnamed protein product [Paramecium octaurelia]|uniref:Uncharacterized protein n=1 Tax=Paramecium octaurelia TaxID=43137 RepID=A0A8S1V7A6_PAROT|nr:unnamed protein product [Paramecium octaurelia]
MKQRDIKLHIYNVDGQEESIQLIANDYHFIMNYLQQKQNTEWILIERQFGSHINEYNIELALDLVAIKPRDILTTINQLSDLKSQIEVLKNDKIQFKQQYCKQYEEDIPKEFQQQYQARKLESELHHIKEDCLYFQNSKIQLKSEKEELQKELDEKKEEIILLTYVLEEKKSELATSSNKIADLYMEVQKNSQEQLCLGCSLNKSVSCDKAEESSVVIETLSADVSELFRFINQSELSKDLRNQSIQNEAEQTKKKEETIQQRNQSSEHDKKSKDELMCFFHKLKNASQDLNQQKKAIANLTIESEELKNTIRKLISKSQSDIQNETPIDLDYLFESNALSDDQGSNLQYSGLPDIFQITFKEQEFFKCIKEKNFFFRKNCILKERWYYTQSVNQQYISIIANGQQINIQKTFTLSKIANQAIDTILNLLIVQGYFTLFQRDLQYNNIQLFQQNWNLKIPKQFLVKDQMGNYYVYQECLKINSKSFVPFQITSPIEQYISSFFNYFYLATNKNLALSDCVYGESNDNKEIIIFTIIIHSNYKYGLSVFDLGKTKIKDFEKIFEVSKGKTQQFWSNELENRAKKVWYDQY